MTCIVGIIEGKKVYIGGDSAGVSGLNVTIRKDTKVFKVDKFIFGCTWSFRMIQLIRFSFKPPKRYDETDVYEYMCTAFINELRQCFKNGGFARVSNGEEEGGQFLVGYEGRLFDIHSDFQVGESEKGYSSCGCGQSYAIGALDAMDTELPAENRIRKALEIAVYRSGGVRPPFIIVSI